MIPVKGFDPRRDRLDNAVGNEHEPDFPLLPHSLVDLIPLGFWAVRTAVNYLFGWIGPNLFNRRLRRVERLFPHSLCCPSCGHILRRR
jgi:hypothetical protein